MSFTCLILIVRLEQCYYKSLFAITAANRQTDTDRHTKHAENNKEKNSSVHDFNTSSPLITELVEHDNL